MLLVTTAAKNYFEISPEKKPAVSVEVETNVIRVLVSEYFSINRNRQFRVWSRFHTSKCPNEFLPVIDDPRILHTFKLKNYIYWNQSIVNVHVVNVHKSTKANMEK